MKKILKYNLIALLAMVFFVTSCDDDDYTGYSKLNPTSPTISVTGTGTGSFTLNESDETTYKFDVTLSAPQIVDVALYVTQTAGDATAGEDYQIVNSNSRVYIPANTTTGQLEIKVLTDEVIEAAETLTLTIGDERTTNAAITPVDVTYTIGNYTEDDLNVEMSWETEVYDQYGELIDATDVADMILGIYDASGTLVTEADGGSFEHAVLSATEADGSYYVVASYYAVEQYPDAVDVDITLDFDQIGVLTKTLNDFEGILQTNLCEVNLQLAEIVKSGNTYTITDDVVTAFNFTNGDFVGNYGGEDGLSDYYAADVDIAVSGSDLTIDGLCEEWMVDWWGEAITNQVPVVITFNEDGTLSIAEQYYMTTDYDGAPYDYSIKGAGTYSLCDPVSLHIVYDLNNTTDGYWVGELLDAYGYESEFTADIALGTKSKIEPGKSYEIKFDKSIIK